MSAPLRRVRGFILLPVVLALTLVAAVAFLLNRAGGMNMQIAAGGLQADSARYVAEAGLAQINFQTQGRNCTGYTDLAATTFAAGSFSATVNPKSGTPVTLASTATLADGATSTLTRNNVTAHRTTQYTVTLQPGAAGLDTFIRSANPTTNYGADTKITVRGGETVALVQFDLSSIPAGSDIRSAQFSLWHLTGGGDTVSAFRVTTPWTEGTGVSASGANWTTYDGVRSWATAGGDYDPASGVTIVLPGNNTWATWDLTAQTAAWNAGTQPNYGFALVVSSGTDSFVSGDDTSNPTLQPKLTVTFLPPCGWVPPPTSVTLPASQDTWIDETGSGTTNYGGSLSFTVTNAAKRGRGLVRFDLSSVPAGTVLTNATLRLYVGSVTTPSNSILTVNRVADPWVEGTKNGSGIADGATWKNRDVTNNWSAGFGIYWGFSSGAPTSTSAISSSFTSGWVEWNVTALAQQWLGSPGLNYGAGVQINTSSAVLFNSREAAANQPQLVLTF